MLNSSRISSLFRQAMLLTGLVGPLCAQAQTPPSDVPPQITHPDPDDQAVTRKKAQKDQQVEEVKQVGGQTEVRVTNSVGTYIVKPNQSVGTSLPGDTQSNSNNAVQWVVKSWGGSKSTEVKEDAPPTLQANPDATDKK